MSETRKSIKIALKDFATQLMPSAAINFFDVMGLKSDRRIGIDSLDQLLEIAPIEQKQRLEKLRPDLKNLHVLFQVTTAEIRNANQQSVLFGANPFDKNQAQSYVTIAAELQNDFSRSKLAEITRNLNQALGEMPVLLLLKYQTTMTLSVAQRRANKVTPDKDVLEKISLIYKVNCLDTNPGHLRILEDFALPRLSRNHVVSDFKTLETAWGKTLDINILNKEFFRELSYWYSWACLHPGTQIPKQALEQENGKEQFFIRLITRLMFVWFLLEKNLVPKKLFDASSVSELLNSFESQSDSEGNYYQAILQNLFFATLNTEMSNERRFKDAKKKFIDPEYGDQNLYRYDELFRNPQIALALFAEIPFLNGGLFENLDKIAKKSPTGKDYRVDGFSSDQPKRAVLPNELFFGVERPVDLNGKIEERSTIKKVCGILEIFKNYKFTIAENSPIEEEVALDPELLGHVFENLLATYNPETKSTARKQTGSFYTPRNVVDFMVDESLISYLHDVISQGQSAAGTGAQALVLTAGEKDPMLHRSDETHEPDDLEKKLRQLFSYTAEKLNPFDAVTTQALIVAIHKVRIIDPACGSGAFPMGALQKLVSVLGKLDPNNTEWKRQRIEKEIQPEIERILNDQSIAKQISDTEARELAGNKLNERLTQIKETFNTDRADLDYARKLGLLEDCIYGVDLQPIAVQIAKLRCFISLIVDQQTGTPEQKKKVIPLPNLETKFVAADSLGKIKREPQESFFDNQLELLKVELREVRHKHFQAHSPKQKEHWRDEDERIRNELVSLLEQGHIVNQPTAKRLAHWNPYNQQGKADFFDPEWMFNKIDFDVVIGNPPYVRQEEVKNFQDVDGKPYKDYLKATYPNVFVGTADLFVYFFKRGFELLREGGILSFICSNKYFRSSYGEKLRAFMGSKTTLTTLIDFGDANVFTAIAYPSILVAKNCKPLQNSMRVLNWRQTDNLENFVDFYINNQFEMLQDALKSGGWRLERGNILALFEKLDSVGKPLGKLDVTGEIRRGVLTGLNEAFVVDSHTRDDLVLRHSSSADLFKPFLRGRDVKRWNIDFADHYVIKLESSENKRHPWSGKSSNEAEEIFARTYPAIYERFNSVEFRSDLIKRTDQGKYFWELRSCGYWSEFEESKIIYPDIYAHQSFAWDEENFYTANTCYFIATDKKWLCGLLNSSLIEWYYASISNSIRGGYLRAFTDYMENLPIAQPSPVLENRLTQLVDFILVLAQSNTNSRTASAIRYLEQVIDALVYELYLPDILHSAGREPLKVINTVDFPALSGDNAADLELLLELHTTLSSPQHPVRKLVFYTDSIPEIRIIEGKDK